MTLSELCIRRPVMTTLITASIIAFGVFGFRLLPVSALPRVDFPTIAVTATLPGASSDTMAASVAGIIERQLSTISGISSMSSSSSQGTSVITIQFDLNRNIDAAALDVQTALTIAQRRLPIEMTTPPSFRKVTRYYSFRWGRRRCHCRRSTNMATSPSARRCRKFPAWRRS
jgi:HAE1 family hydrophobic/amphiphilic exporter-1